MRKAAQQNLAIRSLMTGESVNDKHARRMSRGKAYLQTITTTGLLGLPATVASRVKKSNYIHERGKYSPEAKLAKEFKDAAKQLPKGERKDAFKIGVGVSTTEGSSKKESLGSRAFRSTLERANRNAAEKGRSTVDVNAEVERFNKMTSRRKKRKT
jgi:hypothetical protein